MKQKRALWECIHSYDFSDLVPANLRERVAGLFGGTNATTHAFANKIATKLGWQLDYALRAVVEYKKFVYLGVVSPNEVTPSVVIDKVWHEHQLFTAGYRSFCADVLGRNFDHSPELIPMEEQTNVFSAQYLDTLERYRQEFGVEPPEDIWGRPKFSVAKLDYSYEPTKKRRSSDESRALYDDTPLISLYASPVDAGIHDTHPAGFDGFNGGHSGGAGAGASWSDASSHGHSADAGGSHSDVSAPSCGSHSSCSASSCSASSCGGGGCGGS